MVLSFVFINSDNEGDDDMRLGESVPKQSGSGSPADDYSSKWKKQRRSAKHLRPGDDPNSEWTIETI